MIPSFVQQCLSPPLLGRGNCLLCFSSHFADPQDCPGLPVEARCSSGSVCEFSFVKLIVKTVLPHLLLVSSLKNKHRPFSFDCPVESCLLPFSARLRFSPNIRTEASVNLHLSSTCLQVHIFLFYGCPLDFWLVSFTAAYVCSSFLS